jgi:hypothetical protein
VLLNQTGRPRPRAEEQADEERWRTALGPRPLVRAVTTVDAFARCWVQELTLLGLVGEAMPADLRPAYARLVAAWQARRRVQYDQAMKALAAPIAGAACDREALPDAAGGSPLRELGRRLGIGRTESGRAQRQAALALARRLDQALGASTERLVALHGLEGRAKGEVLARLAAGVTVDAPISEGRAAMWGGVVSGALSGLAADLAASGLTFGAGLLTGAVLGALGGAGVARGMNVARGKAGASLGWDAELLTGLVRSALLRYLAVAHYGRGRGDWIETEYPPGWEPLVAEIVGERRARLDLLWGRREVDCDEAAIAQQLRGLLAEAALETLDRLYPGALAGWESPGRSSR